MLITLRACERISALARAPIFVLWIRLTSRYLQQLRVPCSRRGIRSTTPALAGSSCGGFLSKADSEIAGAASMRNQIQSAEVSHRYPEN
jgi:hypothetical protein